MLQKQSKYTETHFLCCESSQTSSYSMSERRVSNSSSYLLHFLLSFRHLWKILEEAELEDNGDVGEDGEEV